MNLVFFYLFVICSITSINSGVLGKRICESLQLDDEEIEDGLDTSRFVCEKKYEPLRQGVGSNKDDKSIEELSAFEDDWLDYYGENIAQDQEDVDIDEDNDSNKFHGQSRPRSHQPHKSRLEPGTSPSKNNFAEDSSFRVDAEEYLDNSSAGDDSESSAAESDCYPWDTGENLSSGRRRCARTRRGRVRGARTQTGSETELELLFAPSKLIFFDNPISIPKMLEFSVQNPSGRADIHIFSITCRDVQFHPVMFNPQVIPPNGATVLQLLFLPYHIETSVSELLLATSAGQFYYPVEGHAVINPYRLFPLIGYRFPSGASKIDVPIVIYNPHNEVLHIREVFTTKDFLALKGIPANSDDIHTSSNNRSVVAGGAGQAVLPPSTALLDSTSSLTPSTLATSSSLATASGSSSSATLRIADANSTHGSSGDSNNNSNNNGQGNARAHAKADDMAWLVQPGFEKEIITLSISKAMAPGDYKGYLHVKTDRDNIVLPVELQVLEGGVHCPHDLIDFGLLTAVAEQKTMQLWLLNSGSSNLQVLQILPADPDPHLQIQLVPNPILYSATTTGDNPDPCLVATLTYTASNPGKVFNRLLVWTNSSNAALAEVEVPYTVTILHGGVGFDHQRAVFVVPSRNFSYLSMIRRRNKVRFRISRCDECAAVETCTGDDCGGAGAVEQTGRFRSGSHCRRDLALQKAQLPVVIVEREFLLTNYFSVPVTLQAISVGSCSEVLSVGNFNTSSSGGGSSVLLERDGNGNSVSSLSKWPPIMIYFNLTRAQQLAESEEKFLPKTCWAEILTNVSSHRVPLHIVDGALLLSFMDALMIEDALDVHRYQSMKFPCDAPYLAEERRGSSTSSSPPSASLSSGRDSAPHLLPQRGAATETIDSANGTMDGTVTGASNVQQQTAGKRFSCSSSLLNSDEHYVDLGNLSVHEPRNLRIAFSNENPIRIGLDVESASHNLCFCFESSWPISFKEDEAAALHISSLKGRTFREALAEPARCSCAGRDGPLTAAPPPESVPHHGNRSGPSPFDSKRAKSSYHSLFSVVIAESFNTSYSKFSESESDERSVFPCGKQRVMLSLTTPFQQMKLFVYFTAVDAKLSTAVAADDDSEGGVFVLGMERHLKLSTSSSFDEAIKEPQFSVKGDNFSLYFAASLNNKPFIKIRPRGTVSYAIHPISMCNDNGNAGLSNLWNCSYSMLRNARLLDGAGPLQGSVAIADEFKYLEPAMMDVKTPAAAYKIRQRLKRKWLTQFPSGLPLPPVDVIVQAPQTRHVHRVENTTMQSPLAVMADLYSLRLPICSTGDVNWFYINVFNPFKFPLSFSLRQSRSSSSSSIGGGGVIQPQRNMNFSAMEVSNSEVAVKPETISAQGWFNCDIPDAFRDDSEDSNSFTAAASDPSPPPSDTEGRILSGDDASSFFTSSSHNSDNSHRSSPPILSSSSSPLESTPSSEAAVLHSAEELSKMCDAAGLQNLVSLVQGVTLHRRPRGKETNQRTASQISNDESSGDASSPFIMHSLSSAEWVALPYSTARIGPIMVSSTDSRSQGNAAVFYVFNNFTGFDKVEVQGSFGVAQLIVSQVSQEANCSEDKRKFFNVSSESSRSDLFVVKDVVVSSLSDRFRVAVRNNGAVSATIHNVVVGGRSCGTIKSWLRWRRDDESSGMRALCESFPLQVPPNEEVSLVLTPPTSCAYLSKSESFVLLLDDHSGAFSSMEVLLDFYSASSIQQECLQASTSGYLRWLCVVVAAASFAALCILSGRGAIKVSAMWMMQGKRKPDLLRQYRKRKGARPNPSIMQPAAASMNLLKPVNLSSLPILPVVAHNSAGSADLSDVTPHSSDPRSLQSLSLAALRMSLSAKEGETPPPLPIRMKAVESLISKRRVTSTSKSEDTLRKNSTPPSASTSTARAVPISSKSTVAALPASKVAASLVKESVTRSDPNEVDRDKQLTSTESSRHHSITSTVSLTQSDGAPTKSQRPALFLNLDDNFADLAGQSAHPPHYNESPNASSLTGTTSSTDELPSFQNQNNPKQLLTSPSPSPAWEPVTEKAKSQADAKGNANASFTTVPAKKKPQKEKGKQSKAPTVDSSTPVAQRETQSSPSQPDSGEKAAAAGKSVRTGKATQAAVVKTSTTSATNHGNDKVATPVGKLAQPIVLKKPVPVVPPVATPTVQTPSQIVTPIKDTGTVKRMSSSEAFLAMAWTYEPQRQEQRGVSSATDSSLASPSHASKSIDKADEDQSPPQQLDLQPIREIEALTEEEEMVAITVADLANLAGPSFYDEPEPEPEPEQDTSLSLWADDLDLDEVAEFLRAEQERELLEGFGGLRRDPGFTFGALELGLLESFGLVAPSNFTDEYHYLGSMPEFAKEDEDAIEVDPPLFMYHKDLLLDTEEDAAEIATDRNSLTQKQDLPSGRSSFTGDSLALPTDIGDDLTFNISKTTELNPECTPYIPWASRQGQQSALPLHSLSAPSSDLSTASLDLSYSSQQSSQSYRGGARPLAGGLGLGMGLESFSSRIKRGAGLTQLVSASADTAMPYSRQLHSRNRSLNSRSGAADPYPNNNAGLGLGLGLGSLDHSREKDGGDYLDRSSFMTLKQQQQHPSLSSFAERINYGKTPSSRLSQGYDDRARLSLPDQATALSVSPTELNYLNQISPRSRLGAQAPPPGLDTHQRRLARSPYDVDMQTQGASSTSLNSNPARAYYPGSVRETAGSGLRFSSNRGQGSAPLPTGRLNRLPPAAPTSFLSVPPRPAHEDVVGEEDEDDDGLFFHCNDFDDDDDGSGSASRSLPAASLSTSTAPSTNSAGTVPSRIFSSSSPSHRISADRDASSDWDWTLSSRFAGAAHNSNHSHNTNPSNLRTTSAQQPPYPYHSQPLPPSSSLSSSSREQFSVPPRGFGPASGSGSAKKP